MTGTRSERTLDRVAPGVFESRDNPADEIDKRSTVGDLAALLGALDSDKADFWTREMLSEPICRLGGPSILQPLLVAFDRSLGEGHDNDGFQVHLWGLVEFSPEESAEALLELQRSDTASGETIDWLMKFCEAEVELAELPVQIRTKRLRHLFERIRGSR